MITKAFIQYREGLPVTEPCYQVREGFRQLGVPTESFEDPGGVEDLFEKGLLTVETPVHGYIGAVRRALKLLGKTVSPEVDDYPDELQKFWGRRIRESNMGTVRGMVDPVFVKPKEQKLFTGYARNVPSMGLEKLSSSATVPDDAEVYISDIVDFAVEYRCFILEGEILDVRRYKGDWAKAIDRGVVEEAVRLFKSAPIGYLLDFGLTYDGQTLLVEANDGFAFGTYGLPAILAARIVEARWIQMAGTYERDES